MKEIIELKQKEAKNNYKAKIDQIKSMNLNR
jgi:hypothetical protein